MMAVMAVMAATTGKVKVSIFNVHRFTTVTRWTKSVARKEKKRNTTHEWCTGIAHVQLFPLVDDLADAASLLHCCILLFLCLFSCLFSCLFFVLFCLFFVCFCLFCLFLFPLCIVLLVFFENGCSNLSRFPFRVIVRSDTTRQIETSGVGLNGNGPLCLSNRRQLRCS